MNRLVGLVIGLLSLTGLPYVVYLALYYLKQPTGSPADKESWEPMVSIVLPTYNEESIVESKLEDILELDYPMEKVEVVVVDSSDDSTPELIESFFEVRQTPELTLIREEGRRGLAIALNEAYATAKNEVIVKTDCDSRVASDALREATANLSDPEVSAVTGRNAEVLGGSDVERGYRDIQGMIQTLESHIDSTFIFHGPFSAFEQDAIVSIDEDSIADDTELALKIRKQGKRVVFDPAIRYKEAAHSEFSKRRQQKDRRAMGLLRLLWRQRDMLGRYGSYGRAVLPFNWWFMLISPWLLILTSVLAVVVSFMLAGLIGLVIPAAVVFFIKLGSNEAAGPLQPMYALLDTQISLARASIELIAGRGDGTWDIDEELREAF